MRIQLLWWHLPSGPRKFHTLTGRAECLLGWGDLGDICGFRCRRQWAQETGEHGVQRGRTAGLQESSLDSRCWAVRRGP